MRTITPRERVYRALDHCQTDRVPYHLSYTALARQKLEAYYGTCELDDVIGNHIVKYKPRCDDYLVEVGTDLWRDEFGVVWNRQGNADVGAVANCVFERRSITGYPWPDPHLPCRYSRLSAFIQDNDHRFRVVNLGKSLFERAWSMRGLENILIDMLEAPEFVEDLLDAITEFNLATIAELLRYDIDAVMFGDDWGAQRGLLFSPSLWQRLIKPCIGQMYAAVKDGGKKVFIHSCGKVQSLFPELIALGVDVFNPFQPEVMDLVAIKEQYGQQLSFYGGMSIQKIMPFGSPDEVQSEARRLLEVLGRGGGYILAPSHDMPGDIPVENIVALIETVQNQ